MHDTRETPRDTLEEAQIRALTEAAGNGDRAALEALLERYLPGLRAFLRLRAGPVIRARESSSDLAQSVCREILENAERFRFPSEQAFKHWLFTTALRKIVDRRDFYLAQKRDVRRERTPAGARDSAGEAQLMACYQTFSTPSRQAMVREELERIERGFERLADEDREVITLAHVVGLSRAEIGERLGKSEGAVRAQLHRALARLARHLGEE